MTINELIMNIQDRYKMPKEPEENQRTTDLYKQDFGFYSPNKLDKVWYAIKRYHNTNFAPNYSAIVNCMDKAGVGESKQTGDSNYYQQCQICNQKYSMGVSCCPKCNKTLKEGEMVMNSVNIVKCQTIPNDVVVLHQSCSICPIFRGNKTYPRGIKCEDYQGESRGQLDKCVNCPCKDCCLDIGSKNDDMETGTLMKYIKGLIKKV